MITSTPKISPLKIQKYRASTYCLNVGCQLKTLLDAVNFVKQRGFIFFWPIKGVKLPSLWTAVAGSRPVANAHDDPGHITWSWKDESLGKKHWYYAKILRRKSTLISLEIAPYFYALSNNYGDPAADIQIQYEEGNLSSEAKQIFDVLLKNGPMDTIAIRRTTGMTSKQSNSRFTRAINFLQSDFKILPVGISDSGGWRYAFIYELVHRYFPEILQEARYISEKESRQKLVTTYFRSVGAAKFSDISKLFQWRKEVIESTLNQLLKSGHLVGNLSHPQDPDTWYSLKELHIT